MKDKRPAKLLLLLRHAKAVIGGSKSGDHGRPLNDRGRADAPRMGNAMRRKHYIPGRVLCSTARRTVETWQYLAPKLDGNIHVDFVDDLYLAPSGAIARAVRRTGEAANIVLVVGHNPGLEECARMLARNPRSDGERQRLNAIIAKFPTSALAVLEFDIATWSDLAWGTGKVIDFVSPKELADE